MSKHKKPIKGKKISFGISEVKDYAVNGSKTCYIKKLYKMKIKQKLMEKIYKAIETKLKCSKVKLKTKQNKVSNRFNIMKTVLKPYCGTTSFSFKGHICKFINFETMDSKYLHKDLSRQKELKIRKSFT